MEHRLRARPARHPGQTREGVIEMTRHRSAVVCLFVLSALLTCAFVAQSASATPAKNTTAFTCVKVAKAKTGDFDDAHCDVRHKNEKGELTKEGEFTHELIALGETTKVVVSNEKTKNATTETTPGVLKGELAGAKLEIVCGVIAGEGEFKNEEPESKVHTGKGSGTTKFTSCKVEKPTKCIVKEPIEVSAVGEGVEELGTEKKEMGGELRPVAGKIFVSITLENKGAEKCALAGKPLEVEGTAIATGTPAPTEKHSGATAVLTNAMTKETLKIGGKPAEISAVTTVRMAGGEQNPITSTTTT